MVFSGSNVINGSAIVLVCGTGMNTELGKIANKLLNKKDKLSPLQKRFAQGQIKKEERVSLLSYSSS